MSAALTYAVFDRTLLFPYVYGNNRLLSRSGVVIRRGEFYSEASPLPGHSTDSLKDVIEAFQTKPAAQLLEEAASGRGILPPSLRFALEGLVAQRSPGTHVVRSNALLRWKNLKESSVQLGQFERAGYSVCKVKIPARGWEPILDLLDAFPAFTFRLDANLAIKPEILEALISSLERRKLLSRVEYLEEPFAGVWDLEAFRGSPLALAADESAPGASAAMALFDKKNPPSVFIVKPTVAGGLFSLQEFLDTLGAAGKKFVFTSTLECEAGRRSILAFLSRHSHETSGLSTGHLFLANFLGDQAEWKCIPETSAAEKNYLAGLDWQDCP
ncbi:MAG: hypothetical protein ACXVB9_13795 [Bdellovibrionota bacterium]